MTFFVNNSKFFNPGRTTAELNAGATDPMSRAVANATGKSTGIKYGTTGSLAVNSGNFGVSAPNAFEHIPGSGADVPEVEGGEGGGNGAAAIAGLAGTVISAEGGETGNLLGGALAGGASGAALGPAGIVGGAAVGLVGGLIKNKQARASEAALAERKRIQKNQAQVRQNTRSAVLKNSLPKFEALPYGS